MAKKYALIFVPFLLFILKKVLFDTNSTVKKGLHMKNELKFYEKTKDWDFDMFNIESKCFTNWDLNDILSKVTNKNSRILDLGTGGGEKVIKYFPYVKEILATDFSEAMINTGIKNLETSGRKDITFKVMDNLNMEVQNNYYDVVVARHTVTDPKQIFNSLKKDGYLILRGVDKYDCHELKRIFGRGQSYNDPVPISIIDYENILEAGFRDVELIPIHELAYFKDKNILYNFLLKVPIIDDFSQDKGEDKPLKELETDKLDLYISRNTYPQGIRLVRRYYGIVARK